MLLLSITKFYYKVLYEDILLTVYQKFYHHDIAKIVYDKGGEIGGAKGAMPPTFYNFSIGIGFLPYKLILLSLCGPPDLSAFLHPCMTLPLHSYSYSNNPIGNNKVNCNLPVLYYKQYYKYSDNSLEYIITWLSICHTHQAKVGLYGNQYDSIHFLYWFSVVNTVCVLIFMGFNCMDYTCFLIHKKLLNLYVLH